MSDERLRELLEVQAYFWLPSPALVEKDMIHGTDHPEAFSFMVRAYRKVAGRPEVAIKEQQLDLEDLLRELQEYGAA